MVEVCENLTFNAFVGNENITSHLTCSPTLTVKLNDQEINSFLTNVSEYNICAAIPGYSKVRNSRNGILRDGIWFSKNCKRLGLHLVCNPCKLLLPTLSRRLIALRNKTSSSKSTKKKKYVQNLRAKYFKALQSNKIIRKEMRQLEVKLKYANSKSLEEFLNSDKLFKPFKSAVMAALKLTKVKSSRGMRYTTDWLLECLLLRIRSPTAYKHIRHSKLLPLPHPSTLSKLIAGQQCEFGFSSVSLEAIKKQMSETERKDRQGSICFDEIALRETLDFNKGTLKFDGYIDYANYTEELMTKADKNKLADHALVIMFRPFTKKWVQPIAAFATRGAAKGNVLQKLIMEAIIKLEAAGAEVVNVVSDGAKTNKSFWKRLGVSGKRAKIVNKIVHPCDDGRFLYFLCDVPHLLKCMRNHFRKYGIVLFDGQKINFNFYEELLKEDQKRNCGLRKCPKLTNSHILPNCFEKMSLATQLFSRTVATGLQFYREHGLLSFKGSEWTENYATELNSLFDAVNGRIPSQGLRLGSKEMECIKRWLLILTKPLGKSKDGKIIKINTFASSETLDALRITLQSIQDIAEYLINELKYTYILPAKINQDALEKFFGLVRNAGGYEDHPTVFNFIQIYRILSLYTPTKSVLPGNISAEENDTVLVAF